MKCSAVQPIRIPPHMKCCTSTRLHTGKSSCSTNLGDRLGVKIYESQNGLVVVCVSLDIPQLAIGRYLPNDGRSRFSSSFLCVTTRCKRIVIDRFVTFLVLSLGVASFCVRSPQSCFVKLLSVMPTTRLVQKHCVTSHQAYSVAPRESTPPHFLFLSKRHSRPLHHLLHLFSSPVVHLHIPIVRSQYRSKSEPSSGSTAEHVDQPPRLLGG